MIVPGRPAAKVDIERVSGDARARERDLITVEEPLEIRARFRPSDAAPPTSLSVAVTMRTPGHDFELVAGFLFTEGLISRREDIAKLTYCTSGEAEQLYNIVEARLAPGVVLDPERFTRHFYASSSCGVCGKASLDAVEVSGCTTLVGDATRFDPAVIRAAPSRLLEGQRVFDRTGGIHAAGLLSPAGDLIDLFEDVGRHNALDKLVGGALMEGRVPMAGHLVVLSGRASFEMVQKSVMAGIPAIVAVGAPSTLAIDAAKRFGVTLVGFARDQGFNVYAGGERIG